MSAPVLEELSSVAGWYIGAPVLEELSSTAGIESSGVGSDSGNAEKGWTIHAPTEGWSHHGLSYVGDLTNLPFSFTM